LSHCHVCDLFFASASLSTTDPFRFISSTVHPSQ
jgi:hypothetical protein